VNLEIKAKGIKNLQSFLDRNSEVAEKAAAMAINTVARKVYADSKRKILAQVNLSAGYLDGRDGTEPRLKITAKAKPGKLSTSIRGRQRATSLARFDAKQMYAPSKKGGRKKAGISVVVKRQRVKMPQAFFVNLNNGNIGVALRVKEGEAIRNKNIMGQPMKTKVPRKDNAYLLYGPSVQQVFSADGNGKSILQEGIEYVETNIDREFQRQFARLLGG
jgi:hypothetical protein